MKKDHKDKDKNKKQQQPSNHQNMKNHNQQSNPSINKSLVDLNSKEEIVHQIKRINIFLVLSLSLLIFVNVLHFYSFVAYSEPVTNDDNEVQEKKNNDDIISTIFSN